MKSDLEATVRELNADLVRELSGLRGSDRCVLGVFVDLTGEFATVPARTTQINSTLKDLAAKIEDAGLEGEALACANEALEMLRETLDGDIELSRGASGMALYCCPSGGIFHIVTTQQTLSAGSSLADHPFLEPLVDAAPRDSWLVLLVDSSTARILSGSPGGLREIEEIEDDVHKRHSQGGWSQKRFERSVEMEVDWHLQSVLDRATQLHRASAFDHVIAACPHEMRGRLESMFPPEIKERFRGWMTVEIQHASVAGVLEAATPLMEEQEAEEEKRILERLEQELGRHGRAAASPPDVRKALDEKRVEVLVLEASDGAEDVIELAVEQAADVLIVRHHSLPGTAQKMAALLRW